MSKQDTHFFNVFSMDIGLLVAIAIALFALARIVAGETQDKQVVEDASYVKNVEQRVEPQLCGHGAAAHPISAA